MDMLVDLPEPEDLPREEVALTIGSLREEIHRLRDKFGQPGSAILTEVENIVAKYEESWASEATSSSNVNAALANLDQETVIKAQHIVRAYLKRKKFSAVAAQFLSSPLAKELGKRNEIWRDILLTEKTYFQSLVMLYETFVQPLKMKTAGAGSSSQDHKILNDKQIFKIFQNIEEVKNSAKNMWKKLEETCKFWPESTPKIGSVGVSVMQEIRTVYSPYIRGLAKAMTHLAKTRKASQQFADFLERTGIEFAGSTGSEPNLPLHSLLMLPLHRMSQYETYFRELLILTPPEHVDYVDLTRASREIAALNYELSPAKAEAFKAQKLTHINTALKGANVPNILAGKVEGTRIYIREGPLLSIGDRRNKRSYLFLFTDSLVLADINEATEEKQFDFMLPLGGAEIREVHDSQGGAIFNNASTSGGGIAQHLFAIIKENKKVVLGCNTLSERASWMNDISTVINELANASKRGGSKSIASPKLAGITGRGSVLSARDVAEAGSSSHMPSPRVRSTVGGALNDTLSIPSEGFLRSMSRQHATKPLEQFIDIVPSRIRLARLAPRDCLAKFRGPTDDETEMDKYTTFASGKVTSTYPVDKERNARVLDPIADHCGLAAWGNRMLGVVADGCGKGFRAQQAASKAVDTFISDFVDMGSKPLPQNLRELAVYMVHALAHVHENIISGTQVVWDAGTTTLLAAFLVEVEPSALTNHCKWCLVCVNVGDSKAFIWNRTNKSAREVTNKLAPFDMKDPGGRLGPYIYQGAPDLRDLAFSYAFCSEEEFVILCTDGVYDNFDPELSGLSPKDVPNIVGNSTASNALTEIRPEQIKAKWDQLDSNTSAELRAACRARTLEQIIDAGDPALSARSIMRSIVNYCIRQTRSAREYLEQNLAQRLPTDYQTYPGAMDHLTCLAFQVGPVQL